MFRRRKHSKIFIVSIVILDNYKYKITYLLEYMLESDYYKGLFEYSYISSNLDLLLKIKVGKWNRVKLDSVGNIVCVY